MSDAAVAVLSDMNPLIKITAVSDASSSSNTLSAALVITPFTFSNHMEKTPHMLTLPLGLSAVAFIRPTLESPTLARSLELLQLGDRELSAELAAVLLMSKAGQTHTGLLHLDDLGLLNLLTECRLERSSLEEPAAKIKRLIGDWQAECCPVYSVLGSILSQEVVNFFKDPSQVTSGWLVYDSLVGTAKLVSVTETDPQPSRG